MTKPFNDKAITLIFLSVLMMLVSACSKEGVTPVLSDDDIALNNRGVALMGRFDYRAATEIFEQLVAQQPQAHELRTNFAIALKNRQGTEDSERALEQLAIVLAAQPDNLRANYVSGVLQLYLGRIDSAAEYFKAVLATDPNDAYAHYYLGQCQLRSSDSSGALASYQRSIELDPYLRSAYYSSAQVLRRLKRTEEANEQLALFQRFESNPRARLAEFKYTRMGPKSLTLVLDDKSEKTVPPIIPEGELFSKKRIVAQLAIDAGNDVGATDASLMSTVDIDQNGSQDVFVIGRNGSKNRLLLAAENTGDTPNFVELSNHPWQDISDINAVAWGDVDNNGFVDAYLCRTGPNQLWRQMNAGDWQLAGPDAQVNDGVKHCADASMIDADHDGDLDILVANRDASDNLLNNNRDGTFRSLADKLGLVANAESTKHLIATDIDADSDVDLIFVKESVPHQVLINDRLWNYAPSKAHADFSNTTFAALAAVDLNADGQIEMASIDDAGLIKIWKIQNNGSWQASDVYTSALANQAQLQLVPLDLSGNGRAELVVLSAGAFEVVALSSDLSKANQLVLQRYTGGMPLPVTRTTRGSSVMALADQSNSVDVLEWAPGDGRFDFVTLTLSGKHDAAETMRSNHSGIGTRVSVRNGSTWSVSDTFKHSSLPGSRLQPISIGLNGVSSADFIAIDWSDGVYQTELDVASDSVQKIAEEQRQLGSCPVLFVWNGDKYEFVTDILGVAAQGFLVEPGTLLPPRPWERVTFAPGSIPSDSDSIKFKVTEPMQENSYIDAMTLESYDVPADWQIIVDERMGTGAPEVTGKTMFYQKSLAPSDAYNSKGQNVLDDVLEQDNRAMPPGEIDRRFIGLLKEPESLTIEFDQPIERLAERPDALPILVADSWIELPYSQTHFSAWQAGRQYRSVSLEARDDNGNWQSIYPEFGIPGGMPRVVSLPLETLPAGTRALRLSWNREIYWDRIRIVYAELPPTKIEHATLLPKLARVAKSGFYKRLNHAQRRPEYVYQDRKTFGDVTYPTGFYTSLGEMTELVVDSDDALAIIGPGEEIHVEFDTPPPPPTGLQRWYVLETKGWAKDKDMYTYQGSTVGPLPARFPDVAKEVRTALHQKYNTRFQSGR